MISRVCILPSRAHLEDAVVVVGNRSPEFVKGIIADVDVLNKIKEYREKTVEGKPIKNLYDMSALELSNQEFFYVKKGEKLLNAINKMNMNNTTHVVVLDEEDKYLGWITKKRIYEKIADTIEKYKFT